MLIMRRPINKKTDKELDRIFQNAVKKILSQKKEEGKPIATFDENNIPCLEYPDGKREYA